MAVSAGTGRPRGGNRSRPTAELILDAALQAFGTRGYDATSLDDLATDLGVRKQTILYHYTSKEALLDAVIDRSSAEVIDRIEKALSTAGDGFDHIEAIVRAVFRLAARRPAMLGLFREVSRLGPPASTRLTAALDELMHRAEQFLDTEMEAGKMRRHDTRLLLLSGYSMVIGVATEVEVLRALGEEPTLASLVRRRDELVSFLRSALVP